MPDAGVGAPSADGKPTSETKATVTHEGKVETEEKPGPKPLGGDPNAVAAAVGKGMAAAGGAGGKDVQDVNIKGATMPVPMRQLGTSETRIEGSVQATAAGGAPLPVEDTAPIKTVNVANSPLRVAFNAITTMLTIFAAPFGIGMGLGVGFMSAFAKGGDVPDDMIAKIHGGELIVDQSTHTAFKHLVKNLKDGPAAALFRPDGAATVARGSGPAAEAEGLGGESRATVGGSIDAAAPARRIAVSGPDLRLATQSVIEAVGVRADAARAERETEGAARAAAPIIIDRHVTIQATDAPSFRRLLEDEGGDVIFSIVDRKASHHEQGRRNP
jgi:hypothetical protein